MWAVPLAFTCLVVLLGYVAKEAVHLVSYLREKHKTLSRLSTASVLLMHAEAGASVDPSAHDAGSHSVSSHGRW